MIESVTAENRKNRVLAGDDCFALFSRRCHGNMSLVYGDTRAAVDNRRDLLSPAGIDYRCLICAKQTHSNHVHQVTRDDLGKGAQSYDTSIEDTDAFITDLRLAPLSIFTADCLPVFIYDPENKAIGLVHASWRSSRGNITANTVISMKDKFNTRPSELKVSFGPAIGACCFQVGDEFRDMFPGHLISRGEGNYLDLAGVNRSQLLGLGVEGINISDTGLCTFCNRNDFFSFRREGNSCGRMMSVMMLK